ncbi:MAG: WYL domain-containing protein [Pricia sp.]|nr:WYL domain-containing protein [Pricia sp.]
MNSKDFRDFLQQIERAITYRTVLSIKYHSAATKAITKREVEPLGLYFTQNRWMMVAYCRLRKANREFRLDHISEITNTSDTFPPNQFELSDYFVK